MREWFDLGWQSGSATPLFASWDSASLRESSAYAAIYRAGFGLRFCMARLCKQATDFSFQISDVRVICSQ